MRILYGVRRLDAAFHIKNAGHPAQELMSCCVAFNLEHARVSTSKKVTVCINFAIIKN
jgi:hypothetical protein